MNTKTERFEMRLDQATIERIDNWRQKQDDFPSRAEAVRRLTEMSLINTTSLSDGEKFISVMLCEIAKKLKIGNDEINTKFIEEAIYGGHDWAFGWEYQGIFHNHKDNPKSVNEVCDILDMWFFIEEGYKKLSDSEKKLVIEKTHREEISFLGFDGNNEGEHLGIARFLIEQMGRFESFKGRGGLNSHHPVLSRYREMYKLFEPIRKTLVGKSLSANQIIEIINAEYSY